MSNAPVFERITAADLNFFLTLLGPENVLTDPDSLEKYGSDETEDFVFLKIIIVYIIFDANSNNFFSEKDIDFCFRNIN